jgi:hypothetical protein
VNAFSYDPPTGETKEEACACLKWFFMLHPRRSEMTYRLPPLLNGHAPITLQHLFGDALVKFEDWVDLAPEPIISLNGNILPISSVFEAMRLCTDIVPSNVAGGVIVYLRKPWRGYGPLDEMTYSTAARVMSVLVRKRLMENERLVTASVAVTSNRTVGRTGSI